MTTASEPTTSEPAATESAATESAATDPELEIPNDAPFPYDGTDPGSRLAQAPAQGVLYSSDGTAVLEGSATCPDCASETINGAGLFACSNCEWSGSLQ